jgi:hypothetical protein
LSRLGNPAPQPPTGAARFASPSAQVEAPKRQGVKTLKREKTPVTIRLTPDAVDRLAEIERGLRRMGIRARQGASASEIVEALVRAATPEAVRDLLARGSDEDR